jgi:hypothetical protein
MKVKSSYTLEDGHVGQNMLCNLLLFLQVYESKNVLKTLEHGYVGQSM